MGEQGEGHGNGPKPGGGNAKGQSRAKYKTLLREKGEQGMAGQTRSGAGQGMTGQGKARQDSLDQGKAGQGRGITGARAGARQGRAGQYRAEKGRAVAAADRKLRDNAKRIAADITGHSALQENAKGMVDCRTGLRAGQSGRQDRKEARALR